MNLLILIYILFKIKNNFKNPFLQVGSGSVEKNTWSGCPKITGSGSLSMHRSIQIVLDSYAPYLSVTSVWPRILVQWFTHYVTRTRLPLHTLSNQDIDAAFLVGAMPRREGMERKDLLAANVKIFKVMHTFIQGSGVFFWPNSDPGLFISNNLELEFY